MRCRPMKIVTSSQDGPLSGWSTGPVLRLGQFNVRFDLPGSKIARTDLAAGSSRSRDLARLGLRRHEVLPSSAVGNPAVTHLGGIV